MKIALAAAGVIVAVVVFWILLASAVWGFHVATAGIYGRGEAHRQINSAPFRIQAYQSFFDECASIQGLEGKLDAHYESLRHFKEGSLEYNRTITNINGVKGMRQSAIARYNQNALKNYTEGQFRDSDLPYQLSANNYPEEGTKTVCAVQ